MIRTALIALMSAAVVVGAAGCGTSSVAHQTTSTAPSAAPTTSPPPPSILAQGEAACSDLTRAVSADQTCHVHAATSTYKMDLRFPLECADMRAMADFLEKDRDS